LLLQQAWFISASPCRLKERQGAVRQRDSNSVCRITTESWTWLHQLLSLCPSFLCTGVSFLCRCSIYGPCTFGPISFQSMALALDWRVL